MIRSDRNTCTAFAPATVANVAVGFDILGFPIDAIGDTVTLNKRHDNQIIVQEIQGAEGLPYDTDKNVASAVVQKLLREKAIEFGCDIRIEKGIPLGSGMGGSAASAVAALVALNGFLENPLSLNELVPYAVFGEEVATGQGHADNVVPALFGGMTFTQSVNPVNIVQLPVPEGLHCVLIHPDIRIDTKLARQVLKQELPLKTFIQQSANLAGFISGLYETNFERIACSLEDVLIEPHRALLIPNFKQFKSVALDTGALGCSISGSGPSIFALTASKNSAQKLQAEWIGCAESVGLSADTWVSKVRTAKAELLTAVGDYS